MASTTRKFLTRLLQNKFYRILSLASTLSLPLILLLPKQFSKNLYSSFPFWIVVMLACLFIPYLSLFSKKRGVLLVDWLFVAYLVCLMISSLFSVNAAVSTSIFILNSAYLVIFLASPLILSQKYGEIFIKVFVSVVVILSGLSFYRTVFSKYNNLTPEGLSFQWAYFGHNHLAALLILAIPLCLYFFWFSSRKSVKLFFLFSLALLLLSILISYSRGAIVALILSLALGTFTFKVGYLKKLGNTKIIVFTLVFVFLSLILVFLLSQKPIRSVYSRYQQFQKGIEMFNDHPITGYGPGSFHAVKKSVDRASQTSFFTHNLFIQNLAEGGIVLFLGTLAQILGLVVLSVININQITSVRRKLLGIIIWVGIVGLLINEMIDFDLQLPAVGLIFWLIAGTLFSREIDQKL